MSLGISALPGPSLSFADSSEERPCEKGGRNRISVFSGIPGGAEKGGLIEG